MWASHLTYKVDTFCYSHLTGEKTDVQRGKTIFPKPRNDNRGHGFKPSHLAQKPYFLTTYKLPLHYQYPVKPSLYFLQSSLCPQSQETSLTMSPPAWLSFVQALDHHMGALPHSHTQRWKQQIKISFQEYRSKAHNPKLRGRWWRPGVGAAVS